MQNSKEHKKKNQTNMPSPKVHKNLPVTELKDMYLQFTPPKSK